MFFADPATPGPTAMFPRLPALALLLVAPAARAELPPPAARRVEFAADVRPIFVRHCFACHGPDQQKGGLRLDRKAAALQGGDSGLAIRPGDGAGSPLVRRVAGADPEAAMPPKGARLSAAP